MNWLTVCFPPLLSSFLARLQLWAPLPRHEPLWQVHSCWPALSAPCSCSSTGVPEQEGCCKPPVLFVLFFQRHAAMHEVAVYPWPQTAGKSFSPTKDSAWGSWSGTGQRRYQRNRMRSLITEQLCAQQNTAKSSYPRYR